MNSNNITDNYDGNDDDNDEYHQGGHFQLNHQQLLVGVIAPRITGISMLISSCIMIRIAWSRTHKKTKPGETNCGAGYTFHRLILGMYVRCYTFLQSREFYFKHFKETDNNEEPLLCVI